MKSMMLAFGKGRVFLGKVNLPRIEDLWSLMVQDLERQSSKAFLWMPIFLGIGIGIYFLLDIEPTWYVGAAALGLSALFFVIPLLNGRFFMGLSCFYVLFLPALGFWAAQLNTMQAHTAMLQRSLGPVELIGTIKSVEYMDQEGDARVLLEDLRIEDLMQDETPKMVRLRFRGVQDDLRAGERYKFLVRLMPLSSALYPGGFDFRRHFYFQGIGAVGFIFERREQLRNVDAASSWLENIRSAISEHIHSVLDTDQANIVEALLIGQRAGIADSDYEALRNAGLAHLLAISGLHIGLVASAVFFLIRFGLCLFEHVALYYPVKKIAAVFAIVAAFIYMMLAGAPIPTQRAMIMTAVVFGAILLDRWPFSLRVVAISAFCILLWMPHSLLSVSFQLSFAAVTVLVAFSEFFVRQWRVQKREKPEWYQRFLLYLAGVCVTSILATFATAPFALYHFQKVALLGLLGNLVAIPVMSFFVMPFGILALLAMPFHLSYWPLSLMDAGLDIILDTAYWVSDLPHSVFHAPALSFGSFIFFVFAGLFWIVTVGYTRTALIMLFLLLSFFMLKTPDTRILVAPDYELLGIVDESGHLQVSSMRRAAFTRESWEHYLGQESGAARDMYKTISDQCDSDGCRLIIDGVKVAIVHSEYAYRQDCLWADVLLADFYTERRCDHAMVVNQWQARYRGAHSVTIKDGVPVLHAVKNSRMQRPWM